MAREATITQEQVNAAADAIRANGSRPTARAVRDVIGAGSMATVLKMLQVWQGGQVRAAESPVTLPAGLQRALVDFVAQEIATSKADLQADLVNVQQSNNDLIAENERQTTTIDIQVQALEVLQSEKSELAGRLAQVEAELTRTIEDVHGERQSAELARTELAKAQLRLEAVPRIEAEIERLRKELDNERQMRVNAEQVAAVATAKLEAMTDRAKKAETYIDKLEKQSSQVAQELVNARVHVQSQQTALDAAVRECEDLRRRHIPKTVKQVTKSKAAVIRANPVKA